MIVQVLIHEGGFLITRTMNSMINVYTYYIILVIYRLNGSNYIQDWTLEKESITKIGLLHPLKAQFLITTAKGNIFFCDIFSMKYNM